MTSLVLQLLSPVNESTQRHPLTLKNEHSGTHLNLSPFFNIISRKLLDKEIRTELNDSYTNQTEICTYCVVVFRIWIVHSATCCSHSFLISKTSAIFFQSTVCYRWCGVLPWDLWIGEKVLNSTHTSALGLNQNFRDATLFLKRNRFAQRKCQRRFKTLQEVMRILKQEESIVFRTLVSTYLLIFFVEITLLKCGNRQFEFCWIVDWLRKWKVKVISLSVS